MKKEKVKQWKAVKHPKACYYEGVARDGWTVVGPEYVPDYENPMFSETDAKLIALVPEMQKKIASLRNELDTTHGSIDTLILQLAQEKNINGYLQARALESQKKDVQVGSCSCHGMGNPEQCDERAGCRWLAKLSSVKSIMRVESPDVVAARVALDDLDDFARMAGVKAIGALKVLTDFISGFSNTAVQTEPVAWYSLSMKAVILGAHRPDERASWQPAYATPQQAAQGEK